MDLEQETSVLFISIASEAAKEAVKKGYRKVGLLASPMTIFRGLPNREFLDKKKLKWFYQITVILRN